MSQYTGTLYTSLPTREAGEVPNKAKKKKKTAKYAHLETSQHVVPNAVESPEVFGTDRCLNLPVDLKTLLIPPPSDPENLSDSTKGQHSCLPRDN